MATKKLSKIAIKVLRDPLWESQLTEGYKAYEAFRYYRDLGAGRSVKRVCEILGKSDALLFEWSRRFRWQERVQAYDAYLDTKLTAEMERKQRDSAVEWIARRDAIREQEYALAMGLREKAIEMLQYPTKYTTRRKKVSLSGKKVTLIEITEPARWDWNTVAQLIRTFSKESRLAADMVTEGARAPTPEVTDGGMADIDAYLAEMAGKVEEPEEADVEQ